MRPDQKRQIIGLAITFGSIGVFFWWGLHFKVFGQPIVFDGRFLGFFAWIIVSLFGAGYAINGVRTGLKFAGSLALLMAAAFVIGVAEGNYR